MAWIDTLTAWLAAHPHWLGLTVFLLAFGECLAIAGLLIPGTVLLFAVAVLAGNGALPLWETLLLGFVGGMLGDLCSYALGRRLHQNIRGLPVLRDNPQWLASAEQHVERYGVISLLAGRFIGPLRPMLPMVAGMLDMPFGRFTAVSLLAGSGWAVAYLLPGWATGAALRLPLPANFWQNAALVASGLTLLLGLTIHGTLREQRRTTPMSALLSLALLIALLIGWRGLADLDLGLLSLVQEQRHETLDGLMVVITRLGDLTTQLAAGTLLIALLALVRQWRALLFAAIALLGTAVSNGLLKELIGRARPEVLLEPLHSFSLPSGHSSAAFAFFLVLGILAGRGLPGRSRLAWLLLACLPALAIAVSRLYLGVHWPSDLLAGGLLASTWCAFSLALMQRHQVLPALPAKVWWLLLPALLALLGAFATWALPAAFELYRYR